MSLMGTRWCWFLSIGISAAIATSANCVQAQIVPDGTLPNNSRVTLSGNNTLIEGGTQAGGNLLHSFQQFSVPTGSTAFFNNAVDIQNIISRVTGGSVSNIDGLIGANGKANLFLINPNGIIFGRNAQLNIGGSFVASTASSLKFADGTEFSATAPQTTPLLTVSVPIGLQYGRNPASILNQSLTPISSGENFGLQVSPDQTLALVGGNISLDGGSLTVGGGRVELGGLAGVGTVGLNFDNNNLSLIFPPQVERADISLTNGARVNVTAGGGGNIAINAKNLLLTDGSILFAEGNAANIFIQANGSVYLANNSQIYNGVGESDEGNSGDIDIQTGSLTATNGSQIIASTFGQGNAGNINIDVLDVVSLAGVSSDGFPAGVLSFVGPEAVGKGGNINFTSGRLVVRDGAQVSTATYGQGDAGNLNVRTNDAVELVGTSADGLFASGLTSSVERTGAGRGGNLTFETRRLLIQDGAQISTATFGRGDAGNLTFRATDAVELVGTSANGQFASGLTSAVGVGGLGNGGDLTFESRRLLIRDGAQVSTATFGRGNAGNLNVRTIAVELVGTSADGRFASGLTSAVESGAVGNGGSVNIASASLSLNNGAQVSSAVRGATGSLPSGQGRGGRILINAQDSVNLSGVSATGFSSGLFTNTGIGAIGSAGEISVNTSAFRITDGAIVTAQTLNSSDAGNVTINAKNFEATSGGQVLTTTRSAGNAGSIILNASDNISLSGVDPSFAGRLAQFGSGVVVNENAASGLFASTDANSTGNGGNISIDPIQLKIANGAIVSASSLGTGDAGNIEAEANSIILDQGQLTAESTTGRGGNIQLRGDLLLLRRNSLLSTISGTPQAAGNEGNISIDTVTGFLIALEKSNIIANAFAGPGANILVNAQGVLFSSDSSIVSNGRRIEVPRTNIQHFAYKWSTPLPTLPL